MKSKYNTLNPNEIQYFNVADFSMCKQGVLILRFTQTDHLLQYIAVSIMRRGRGRGKGD